MKRSTFVLPAVALALLLASPSWAGDREANDQAPKVIGLLFDAEWCGTCKVLVPKLDAVKPQF